MASTVFAYFCWLFGSGVGLHHLYLRRDMQAYLTASLLPLVVPFWFAWFRDMFRLPDYVDSCNEDRAYMDRLKLRQEQGGPPMAFSRIVAQLFFGSYFGLISYSALSIWSWFDMELPVLDVIAASLGVAVGVWAVGCVGHQQVPFKPLFAAALALIALRVCTGTPVKETIFHASVAALLFATRSRRWKPKQRHQSGSFKRMAKAVFIGTVFVVMFSAAVFNGIQDVSFEFEGDQMTLKEALNNMLKSPTFQKFKSALWDLWTDINARGWEEAMKDFLENLDVDGETHSYSVLGLKEGCTQEEVKKSYRRLARTHHPDKGGDEVKFREIQEAYETLKKVFARRAKVKSDGQSKSPNHDGEF